MLFPPKNCTISYRFCVTFQIDFASLNPNFWWTLLWLTVRCTSVATYHEIGIKFLYLFLAHTTPAQAFGCKKPIHFQQKELNCCFDNRKDRQFFIFVISLFPTVMRRSTNHINFQGDFRTSKQQRPQRAWEAFTLQSRTIHNQARRQFWTFQWQQIWHVQMDIQATAV